MSKKSAGFPAFLGLVAGVALLAVVHCKKNLADNSKMDYFGGKQFPLGY
ncbi:hypothetical protein OVA07_07840 [Novosphingobium sp. SL115]|nr:hypothetical protein [Novosphingobium sp. SL115]MCY1670926.1 hypothetical protein [Novosphingobium sp. SL115]